MFSYSTIFLYKMQHSTLIFILVRTVIQGVYYNKEKAMAPHSSTLA